MLGAFIVKFERLSHEEFLNLAVGLKVTQKAIFSPSSKFLIKKPIVEMFQYNACLAITGAFRGTSKEKLYQELGLESFQFRRRLRKLFFLQGL